MPHDHADGSEALEAAKSKYIGIMKEFLEIRGWTDEFEVNEDSAQINFDTGLNIGDQQGHLYVHLNYDNDTVDVYVYYGFRCKKNKFSEMIELLNAAHLRWALGRFELVPDGRIRWRHRVDFEGSSPTGVSLLRIIQPGWDCAASFVDAISAVAMTNQNAAQAIEEYDEAEAAARAEANDGAPTEL